MHKRQIVSARPKKGSKTVKTTMAADQESHAGGTVRQGRSWLQPWSPLLRLSEATAPKACVLQLEENSVRLCACVHVNIILFLHNVDYLSFGSKSIQGFRLKEKSRSCSVPGKGHVFCHFPWSFFQAVPKHPFS